MVKEILIRFIPTALKVSLIEGEESILDREEERKGKKWIEKLLDKQDDEKMIRLANEKRIINLEL